jgi:cytochrome P450
VGLVSLYLYRLETLLLVNSFLPASIDRLTTRDITLSDGTFIPKGVHLSAASGPLMKDKEVYGGDADKFNGFRFSDRRSRPGEQNKHQLTQISSDFLAFGMGSRAWCVFFRSFDLI